MAKKGTTPPSEPESPPRPGPRYTVTINGGNGGSASIADLSEIGGVASQVLVDGKAREVTLTVKPILVPGKFAMERADGVKLSARGR